MCISSNRSHAHGMDTHLKSPWSSSITNLILSMNSPKKPGCFLEPALARPVLHSSSDKDQLWLSVQRLSERIVTGNVSVTNSTCLTHSLSPRSSSAEIIRHFRLSRPSLSMKQKPVLESPRTLAKRIK